MVRDTYYIQHSTHDFIYCSWDCKPKTSTMTTATKKWKEKHTQIHTETQAEIKREREHFTQRAMNNSKWMPCRMIKYHNLIKAMSDLCDIQVSLWCLLSLFIQNDISAYPFERSGDLNRRLLPSGRSTFWQCFRFFLSFSLLSNRSPFWWRPETFHMQASRLSCTIKTKQNIL